MITLGLRDAIARAVDSLVPVDAQVDAVSAPASHTPRLDPALRPGPRPGAYSTSLPFGLATFYRTTPSRLATDLARLLGTAEWVAEAVATGGGYVTITVTPAALASVATGILAAGPDCVRSEVLRGVTVRVPESARAWQAAPTWEEGRAAVAAELTVRLAEAAGATLAPEPGEGRPAGRGEGREGPVAAAVAVAGADVVRFALARVIPGKPASIHGPGVARNSLDNPAYAVRYAHARAVSGVRWAAALGATMPAQGEAAVPCLPADPAERALLDALSWLPERVAVAARRARPDEFARYLEDLARATIAAVPFTRPGDDERLALARVLAEAARTGLAAGLGLLAVAAPDRL